MRRRAVAALTAHKQEGLQQLKNDPDEMLRGVSFKVSQYCCHALKMIPSFMAMRFMQVPHLKGFIVL